MNSRNDLNVGRTLDGAANQDCFLCHPDGKLLVAEGKHILLMAGLGPVVDNYCIMSATEHFKSFADVLLAEPKAIQELLSAREKLESTVGPVLLTEHGRVPICREDGDVHDEHCHHAHGLVFPGTFSISSTATSYYQYHSSFGTLWDALAFAASSSEYMLISEKPDQYLILSGTLGAPRQLARTLVAHAIGDIGLADWRVHPNPKASIATADRLRNSFGGAIWES